MSCKSPPRLQSSTDTHTLASFLPLSLSPLFTPPIQKGKGLFDRVRFRTHLPLLPPSLFTIMVAVRACIVPSFRLHSGSASPLRTVDATGLLQEVELEKCSKFRSKSDLLIPNL